jgi:hypothetical protein
LFAKTYAVNNLGDKLSKNLNNLYKYISIESGSIVGLFLILSGILMYLFIFINWLNGFGSFGLSETKKSILAFTLIIMGVQTVSSSFMLSILGIKR